MMKQTYSSPTHHWLQLFILLLLFAVMTAGAAEPIGKILFVHGQVEIISADKTVRQAEKGGSVFEDDRILTKDASSLQLQMSDNGYFAVRPNSEILLEDYQFKNDAQDKVTTSIIRGGLRSITGAVGQKDKKAFLIRTPVATIGIRGTDLTAFFIHPEVASAELGAQGSYLSIESGGGYLQNSAGMQILSPGQAAYTASANLAPAAISQLPGIFLLPTFEEIIPGINDSGSDKAAADEPKQGEQPPEEPKDDDKQEQPKEEQTAQNDDTEDRFRFRAHASTGIGSSDHFLHTYDLNDPQADTSFSAMMALQQSPYDSSATFSHLAAGVGASYQPFSLSAF